MSSDQWEVLTEVHDSLQAEIVKGFLEAQGIQVVLSQEGAGHYAFRVNVGRLSRVEVLVPANQLEQAQALLQEYSQGDFDADEPAEEG